MKRMIHKWFSALIVLVMLTTALYQNKMTVLAEGENSPALSVQVSKDLVAPGDEIEVVLSAENFNDIGGFQVVLQYNADVFEVQNCGTLGMLDGQLNEVKADVPGEIMLSSISAYGYNGSDRLLSVVMRAKESAEPRTCEFGLLVKEVYNSFYQPVTLRKKTTAVDITEKKQEVKNLQFSLQAEGPVAKGDVVNVSLSADTLHDLTSGRFIFMYDEANLAFKEAVLAEDMKVGAAICAVNNSNPGVVSVSYVNDRAVSPSDNILMTLSFTVLTANSCESRVMMQADNLCDENGITMKATECDISVVITEKEETVDYPDLRTIVSGDPRTGVFQVAVLLDGASKAAAGDFTMTYDPALLQVERVWVNSTEANGSQIVTSPKYENGTIRFSFINVNGIKEDQTLVHVSFMVVNAKDVETDLGIRASGLVNAEEEDVKVDCIGSNIVVSVPYYEVEGVSLSVFDEGYFGVNHYLVTSRELTVSDRILAVIGKEEKAIAIGEAFLGRTAEGNCRYKVTVPIRPEDLTIDTAVRLKDGAGNVLAESICSGETYALQLIDSGSDAEKEVAIAMLNYGAAVQTYFGKNTSNLPNRKLSASQKNIQVSDWTKLDKYKPAVIGSVSGFDYLGSSIVLDGQVKIRHYFIATTSTSTMPACTQNDKSLTVQQNGNIRIVESDPVRYTELPNEVVVKIGSGMTLNYNVLSYLRQSHAAGSKDDTLHNVIAGLYLFGEKLIAYSVR